MDKQQALQQFFSQFATAYEESDVPDNANLNEGYITYQKMVGSLDEPVFPSARIWTRSTSWNRADSILNSMDDALKRGGQIFKLDEGRMWIARGTPFGQAVSEDDRAIRSYLINLAVEFFTE